MKYLTSIDHIIDNPSLGALVGLSGRLRFKCRAVDIAISIHSSLKGITLPAKDIISMLPETGPERISLELDSLN